MKRFGIGLGSALLLVLPAGCESFRLFNDYTTVESPEVAAAPWPRLVDVPAAPPPGSFSAAVPDPAQGVAVETELDAGAGAAAARLGASAAPVLSEEDRAALGRRDEARLNRARQPLLSDADRSRLTRD